MRFSIITPSFRNLDWLKLCIASVADQEGVHEHIVQDACSDDGTAELLRDEKRVTAVIEKDRGMYDAVNRGFRRATGDILAYLNCDEQYLPGTLSAVRDYFHAHPEVEVAFATVIVTNPQGAYVCDRVPSIPHFYHSWVTGNLAVLTAGTFCRRSVFATRGLYFDEQYRAVGDGIWVMNLIRERVPMGIIPIRTSVFVETGQNMGQKPHGVRERMEMIARAPWWARQLRIPIVVHYRLRRFLAGHYFPRPAYDYQVYTQPSPKQRVQFHVAQPRFRLGPR